MITLPETYEFEHHWYDYNPLTNRVDEYSGKVTLEYVSQVFTFGDFIEFHPNWKNEDYKFVWVGYGHNPEYGYPVWWVFYPYKVQGEYIPKLWGCYYDADSIASMLGSEDRVLEGQYQDYREKTHPANMHLLKRDKEKSLQEQLRQLELQWEHTHHVSSRRIGVLTGICQYIRTIEKETSAVFVRVYHPIEGLVNAMSIPQKHAITYLEKFSHDNGALTCITEEKSNILEYTSENGHRILLGKDN